MFVGEAVGGVDSMKWGATDKELVQSWIAAADIPSGASAGAPQYDDMTVVVVRGVSEGAQAGIDVHAETGVA